MDVYHPTYWIKSDMKYKFLNQRIMKLHKKQQKQSPKEKIITMIYRSYIYSNLFLKYDQEPCDQHFILKDLISLLYD